MIQASIHFDETPHRHAFTNLFERGSMRTGDIERHLGVITGRVTSITPVLGATSNYWAVEIEHVGRIFVDVIRRVSGDLE